MSRLTYTQADYSGEKTYTGVDIVDLTAANFDATVTLCAALETAIQNVCIGEKIKREISSQSLGSGTHASDTEAQREMKWLVSFHDNSFPQRSLSIELGCADIIDADLLVENSDVADLTDADWIAFVAAFEAVAKAPYTGNAVTVDRITLVGRNL